MKPRLDIDRVNVNTSCRASLEELAALSDSQRAAFLDGVSKVIGATKTQQEDSK